MSTSQRITTSGVVHGNTIVLTSDPGLADGMQVQVVMVPSRAKEAWGAGIIASAGALADDWTEEDDRILQEIYEARKKPGRMLPP